MSFGFSTGKLLTQMQLNNIHSGKCNTSTYGSIWTCMGRSPREESDEGCAGKRNGETGAESETYKERVWFNLLSKPWNGIGVIRESKKYICASLPSTPLVFDAPESTIYTKTAPSPASLHCNLYFSLWSFMKHLNKTHKKKKNYSLALIIRGNAGISVE